VTLDRTALASDAHEGFVARGGTPRVRRARAALSRALWRRDGLRRLPGEATLDRCLSALTAEELAWICELSPLGPLYLLPTRRFVSQLAAKLRLLGVKRVLEVAAGDGFLSRALSQVDASLDVVATDSGAWRDPNARMSTRERRTLRRVSVPGIAPEPHVQPLDALRALETFAPDLVMAAWLPPGDLLDQLIRAPVRYVLDVGAVGNVTAGPWSWRFAHETCDGALEASARCRLDTRPSKALHSRITLYFGGAHEEHHEATVGRGDWLWSFRPTQRRR
jgi:hypothetical protein